MKEKLKIAIQGIKGSNHHQVAIDCYGAHQEMVPCLSFNALVQQLLQNKADKGVMAIENSIAGSIIPNYALVYDHHLHIVGEHYLNIHHHLMALSGQKIEDIKAVHSHPMALLQCQLFFEQYPHIQLVEDVDTAETAQRIQKNQLQGIAAIAPKVAAALYGLEVLATDIQTIKNNATRFILVKTSPKELAASEINKASLRFVLDHKRGSLAAVLNVMSDCDLNLTKIQSLPVIDIPWKYAFIVDITFEKYEDYLKAIAILEIMAEEFRVLGAYKNARVL
jgi:prephenate dehydratase